jgi:hypothetical protein
MGFDPRRVPLLREALGARLAAAGGVAGLDLVREGPRLERPFRPPRAWPSLGPSEP